jgi:hypothetical protein
LFGGFWAVIRYILHLGVPFDFIPSFGFIWVEDLLFFSASFRLPLSGVFIGFLCTDISHSSFFVLPHSAGFVLFSVVRFVHILFACSGGCILYGSQVVALASSPLLDISSSILTMAGFFL